MASQPAVSFSEVFEVEQKRINTRRANAGIKPRKDTPKPRSEETQAVNAQVAANHQPDEPPLETVGLALSGGGVRSGSLNLGLLQVLYKRGLLRQVDYLSTVSGGGYVGSFLSSTVHNMRDDESINWQPDKQQAGTTLPLHEEPNGQQSSSIKRLLYGGKYLNRPLLALNRYLLGLVLTNLVILSALLALCALAAWIFRWLDYPYINDRLAVLGFRGDVLRAFFPSSVIFVAWIAAWITRAGLRKAGWATREESITSWLSCLLVASVLMAGVVILNTGDINLSNLEIGHGTTVEPNTVNSGASQLYWILGVVLLVTLLPYMRPKDLIRSGERAKQSNPGWQGWVFAVASRALLYGVPLLIFGWFAHENISHWNSLRPDRHLLSHQHIRQATMPDFWHRVEDEYQKTKVADRSPSAEKSGRATADLKSILTSLASGSTSTPPDLNQSDSIDSYRKVTPSFLVWRSVRGVKYTPPRQITDELNLSKEKTAGVPGETSTAAASAQVAQSRDSTAQTSSPQLSSSSQLSSVQTSIKQGAPPTVETTAVREMLSLHSLFKTKERETGWLTRWLYLARVPLGNDESYALLLYNQIYNHVWQQQLTDAINSNCIENPFFYASFCPDKSTDKIDRYPFLDESQEESLRYWRERGKLLSFELLQYADDHGYGKDPDLRDEVEDIKTLRPKGTFIEIVPSDLDPANPGSGRVLNATDHLNDWFRQRCKQCNDQVKADEELLNGVPPVGEQRSKLQKVDEQDHSELARLSSMQQRIREINRSLFDTYYTSEFIRPESTVFGQVVILADQQTRWNYFLLFGALFVIFGLIVNLNLTSLHSFYRDRLAELWIDKFVPNHQNILMKDLDTNTQGAPYHLLNCSVNLFGRSRNDEHGFYTGFMFSKEFCGSDYLGFQRTESYNGGTSNLADAMAISGAAFTPTVADNPLLAAVLLLTNMRLGQWLPNPVNESQNIFRYSPLYLFIDSCLYKPEERHSMLLTDGGHYDNTGIGVLLQRRCRIIVACDAGQDENYTFRDFLKLIRHYRVAHGIRFYAVEGNDLPVNLDPIIPSNSVNDRKWSSKSHLIIRIEYPNDDQTKKFRGGNDKLHRAGYLIFAKSALVNGLELELAHYREENPAFPHDPTLDQFYDERRFECYRQLGFQIGKRICDDLLSRLEDNDPVLDTPWLSNWSPTRTAFEATTDTEITAPPEEHEKLFNEVSARRFFEQLQSNSSVDRTDAAQVIHDSEPNGMSDRLCQLTIDQIFRALQLPEPDQHVKWLLEEALKKLVAKNRQAAQFFETISKPQSEKVSPRNRPPKQPKTPTTD